MSRVRPPPDDPAADVVSARGEIVLYATEDGHSRIECRFEQGSLWLSQAAMVELYQTSKQNVSKHLRSIFAEGEMEERAVVNYSLTTALDGKTYQVAHPGEGGPHPAEHGPSYVEGKDRPQGRRLRRQELPRRGRDRRAEPHRGHVPGPCGGPDPPAQVDSHGGVAEEARRLPRLQRAPRLAGGTRHAARGRGRTRRGRIRALAYAGLPIRCWVTGAPARGHRR